ncbi:MAG: TIGR00730 family Rossman fold protein [Planctomycetota bacterium]
MTNEPDAFCVTVFCGSGNVDPSFHEAARELGEGIGNAGMTLVYGGNYTGLMADVSDGVRNTGGRVVGISPPLFGDLNDTKCDEFVIATDMRHRKAEMEQRGDAFVILPGGIGTLEEFFEILVGRQLHVHAKPVILLDINGFYRPLIDWMKHATTLGFVRQVTWEELQIATSADEALQLLANAR